MTPIWPNNEVRIAVNCVGFDPLSGLKLVRNGDRKFAHRDARGGGGRPLQQHWTLPTDEIRVIWKATEETIPAGLRSLYDHHEFVGYLGGVG